MNTSFWLRIGAIWGFLAVAIGAFGAHGLKDRFKSLGTSSARLRPSGPRESSRPPRTTTMYCALAILAVGLLAATGRGGTALHVAGWSLLVGSLIFSGSLYVLAATGDQIAWHDHADRRRCSCLIGWVALAVAAGSRRN